MAKEHVSDLRTSRDRSATSVRRSEMRTPFSPMPEPDLTSLVRSPQASHDVAMMMHSLKNGMSGGGAGGQAPPPTPAATAP